MHLRLACGFAGAAILSLGMMGCSDLEPVGPGPNGNDNDQVIGQSCEATLSVTGTFTPVGTGMDELGEACDPEGSWTLNVALDDAGDCDESAIAFETSYTYSITWDEDEGYIVIWDGDPLEERSYLKVTIEGPCQGDFEHYSSDGLSEVILRPYTTDPVTSIAGTGTFSLYDSDQLADNE